MDKRVLQFDLIKEFKMFLSYSEVRNSDPDLDLSSHIHNQCEIYINISGNVSFMVENEIYPISSGDIIITRPDEYHHCIYHGNELHKHFWILFSANGNERMFERFFKRKPGEKNLIILTKDMSSQLIKLCTKMIHNNYKNDFEYYFDFFKLISIINNGTEGIGEYSYSKHIPSELIPVIRLINSEFRKSVSVENIAERSHISVNTLERYFRNTLNMTPTEYIKKKRLHHSANLLKNGKTVLEACEMSGFADYSHFIATFKKYFGITPLKYKKYPY